MIAGLTQAHFSNDLPGGSMDSMDGLFDVGDVSDLLHAVEA